MIMKRVWRVGGAWAGAAGIAVSALLYLLDFATTLSTLRAYYLYEYQCPSASPSSVLVRRDPICHAVRSGFRLHNFGIVFWFCLLLLLLAHLTYAIIFYLSLPPSSRPLRLAFFLPLIHLHRLLLLLRSSFDSNRVKELVKSQKELTSLNDARGVALETAPQFAVQLTLALNLGQYVRGSSNPTEQAQDIPRVMLLSLIIAIISGTYGSTMAMFLALENHMPLFKRAFIAILYGIQTFVAMLGKGINNAFLFQITGPKQPIPLAILIASQFIIAWLFSCLVVRIHYQQCVNKSTWLKISHSLGVALMIRVIGPMYMLTKLNKSLHLFCLGDIFHILGNMIFTAFIFFWHMGIVPPCHASTRTDVQELGNKYLTYKVYVGITSLLYCVFILTTLLVIWAHKKGEKNGGFLPTTSIQISNRKHKISPMKCIISKFSNHYSIPDLHKSRLYDFFYYILFPLAISCITILQKNIVCKVATNGQRMGSSIV